MMISGQSILHPRQTGGHSNLLRLYCCLLRKRMLLEMWQCNLLCTEDANCADNQQRKYRKCLIVWPTGLACYAGADSLMVGKMAYYRCECAHMSVWGGEGDGCVWTCVDRWRRDSIMLLTLRDACKHLRVSALWSMYLYVVYNSHHLYPTTAICMTLNVIEYWIGPVESYTVCMCININWRMRIDMMNIFI